MPVNTNSSTNTDSAKTANTSADKSTNTSTSKPAGSKQATGNNAAASKQSNASASTAKTNSSQKPAEANSKPSADKSTASKPSSTEAKPAASKETSNTEVNKSTANTNESNTKTTANDKEGNGKTQAHNNRDNAKANAKANKDKAHGTGSMLKEKILTPREERLMELKKQGIDMEKIMEVEKTPAAEKMLAATAFTNKTVGQVVKNGNLGTVLEFGKKFKEVEKVANDLDAYIYSIGGVNDPEEYVRATYGVYLSIIDVLKEKDFGKFNTKFRYLIGIICNAKKEAKADELTFLKHDTSWKWGGGEFKKFHTLITAIYASCDVGIKNVGNVVDLEKVVSELPAEAKANVKAFFTK